MEEVLIANSKEFENKIEEIKKDGAKSIQVVSDFDKTLTKAFIDGKKIMSSYAILRENKYLGEEYSAKAFALFDEYHPYELSTELTFEEKKQKMDEWWSKHLELMIKSGINKEIFKEIADKDHVKVREGLNKFIEILNKNNIPFLIFSAGLGDVIKEVLRVKGFLKQNVNIIANFFKFNGQGNVIGYDQDIVHVFNKNTIEHDEDIPERKNVILLGDNIDDLGMVEGISYDTIIKIGFLNEKIEERKKEYLKHFDIIIVNDGSFNKINEIFEKII
ncbi:MAG: hypothetical protein ABIF40_03720 [archaeon]